MIMTEREKRVLEILKEKDKWVEHNIERQSAKEFDIHIEGKKGISDSIYGFSAWMPLAIIYNVNWADNKIWKLSNGYGEKGYIPVQGYDWSGIRDSSTEAIWEMMWVALRMMGIYVNR